MRDLIATMARRFCRNVRGATAIEYALIASGVSVVIVVAVTGVGDAVKTTLYDKLAAMF